MKKLLIFAYIMVFGLLSQNADAMDRNSACFRDLEVNFFRSETVSEALSSWAVPQSQWLVIIQNLQSQSQYVPQLLTSEAGKLIPNPLNYPVDPIITEQLLLSIQYNIFNQVITQVYNDTVWTDWQSIPAMFNYIRRKQRPRLVNCFGEAANPPESQSEQSGWRKG